MKRTIPLAIMALFYVQAHSQLKGLLNKGGVCHSKDRGEIPGEELNRQGI